MLFASILPRHHVCFKSLLSFHAAFRVYCQENLNLAAMEMVAPDGNYVISQAAKILDNPNICHALAECWDLEVNCLIKPSAKGFEFSRFVNTMVEYVSKLYPLMNSNGHN
jgi:hypothetical protein